MDEIFTRTSLGWTPEGKNYGAQETVPSFVAVFTDRNTTGKKTASMTRVYTYHTEIIAAVVEDMGQWVLNEKQLDSLKKR